MDFHYIIWEDKIWAYTIGKDSAIFYPPEGGFFERTAEEILGKKIKKVYKEYAFATWIIIKKVIKPYYVKEQAVVS